MSTNPTTPSDNTVEAIRDFLVKGDYRTDTNVGLNRTAQAIHSLTTQARISELENITGFSNIGGVYTKAGVDVDNPKGWNPITIKDRIKQLKGQL